jgi:phage terminase small subunit
MNDQTGKRFVKRRRHPKRKLLCHTARQRDFVLEYLKDCNGRQAAIRAGYSKASASTQAGLLLKTPWVAKQIELEMERRAARLRIEAEDVLREIADHASANIYDYLEILPHGKVKINVAMLTRDSTKGIAECRITKEGFSIKLTDRLQALDLLGRHLGLFVDRHEHDFGERDLYVQLAAALGIDKASDQELEEASRLLEEVSEEPHPQ